MKEDSLKAETSGVQVGNAYLDVWNTINIREHFIE